ncbi:non-canonical purine NTP pyrophosphatase, RdgB/HAM1 family [Paraprevotella xylaniphila YIT 11841]|uniref:dITP/XTP pyrophosphatase n=1 Tax=Paraprevotella xylaniphila YIT 11841 TaxID=762982 RepID=F3QVK0_9BACT|nr:non-canonical purine NTP diphosphatase [Paraprevotella xylaniphila]EGG52781.1 non-canonical purine NTP pyrophosphatase, RdgB/HAM1 family [Paraprevotella xylaniphila YIT 11841]
MRKRLVFVTNNAHKLEEIRTILGERIEILSLSDIGCHADIPETADTLEGNARQKSRYVYEHYGLDCFADDTGLEVESLGGAPGVYSARYAGRQGHDSQANMNKLLKEMEEKNNRKAQFRTIISLIEKGEERQFEGIVKGQITKEKRGESGFGYDPIFQPDGYDTTFAELGSDIKNRISHRARAVAALCDYLTKES